MYNAVCCRVVAIDGRQEIVLVDKPQIASAVLNERTHVEKAQTAAHQLVLIMRDPFLTGIQFKQVLQRLATHTVEHPQVVVIVSGHGSDQHILLA